MIFEPMNLSITRNKYWQKIIMMKIEVKKIIKIQISYIAFDLVENHLSR